MTKRAKTNKAVKKVYREIGKAVFIIIVWITLGILMWNSNINNSEYLSLYFVAIPVFLYAAYIANHYIKDKGEVSRLISIVASAITVTAISVFIFMCFTFLTRF